MDLDGVGKMPKTIGNRQKIFTKRDFMADLKKISHKIDKPKVSPKQSKT